jgi:NAD(P)-dependent dehydrogenase (short-subunit alcohol dehydrogenase family)
VDELRFDGRVAIVTGAGGQPNLGQAYASLLAERGARVVVNDLGVGPDGRGIQRADAEAVAQEIRDAGGEAIADTNSVATEDGAKAVVQTALDTWGRVDVVVNNAGIFQSSPFEEMSAGDITGMVDAHLLGSIWMSRAAWPHMKEAGYGRIVNIVSGALFGYARMAVYGAVKGGCLALTRCLASEGIPYGIKVNALGPGADTVAASYFSIDPDGPRDPYRTVGLVAPATVYLAHESIPFSGKYLEARCGMVAEVFLGHTKGILNTELTLEDVAENIDQILDRDGFDALPEGFKTNEEIDPRFRPYVPYVPA